jgi:ethanolamine utilization protein EutA
VRGSPGCLSPVEALESHAFLSVGIDIGSSTSHFGVSRLVIRRKPETLSTEFEVSSRETLHVSPVWLTPYRDGASLIDTDRIRGLIEAEYRAAGLSPADIDTGALVITGEALKKANAENIARMMSDWSGRFVCVSAGPMHEGMLAAHGSGSVALSAARGAVVVNCDMGGGTTKISVVRNGVITHTESISVGARLVAFQSPPEDGDPGDDDPGEIVRWERSASVLAGHLGLTAGVGGRLPLASRHRLADLMASLLTGLLSGDNPNAALREELTVATDGGSIPPVTDIDHLVLSGGVSEYLVPGTRARHDDLGYLLAQSLRERLAHIGLAGKIHPSDQRIRATVLGASQFSVQASGQTIFVSDPAMLPARDLQSVEIDARGTIDEDLILTALRRLDLDRWSSRLAAVISLDLPTSHARLHRIASVLASVAGPGRRETALFVVLRADVARAFGTLLKEEVRWPGPVVVVDGIEAGNLDHLDIGLPLGYTGTLPVTITSLQFPVTSSPSGHYREAP